MKNNSTYKFFFMSLLALMFSLVSSSIEGPSEEDVKRILNGKPGEVNWTEHRNSNGVVEYSMEVKDCSTGQCAVVVNKHWRQSKGYVYIDGHYFLAETLDSIDGTGYPVQYNKSVVDPNPSQINPKRVNFSAAVAEPANNSLDFDLATLKSLSLNYNSSFGETLKQVLPSVFVGLKNGIDDLNQALATSKKLHDAYMNSLNQTKRFIEFNEQQTQQTRDDAVLNSGMSSVVLGQLQGLLNHEALGTAGIEKIKALNEFRMSQKNPYIYKQYEITEEGRKKAAQEFTDAIGNGEIRKAVVIAEMLINQKDSKLSAEAQDLLSKYVKSGIINVTNITSFGKVAPLDGFSPKTIINTPSGELVRRVANQAQIDWVETNEFKYSSESKKSLYVAALGMLVQADEFLSQEENQKGFSALDIAKTLLDGSRGFVHGLTNGLVETVKALPELAHMATQILEYSVRNPEMAIDQAYALMMSTPKIVRVMMVYAVATTSEFITADTNHRGEMLGHLASDVLAGYLTGEASALVSGAARGIRYSEIMGASAKALQGFIAGSEASGAILKSAMTMAQNTSQLTVNRAKGLLNVIKSSPGSAINVLRVLGVGEVESALTSTSGVGQFLGKVLATNAKELGQKNFVENLVTKYQKFERGFAKMQKATVDEEVWRGISKTIGVDGKTVKLTEADIFKLHSGNQFSDHRFSIGGPEGEMALYTTRGEKKLAIEIIEAETGKDSSDLIIGSQRFRSEKVLDLTNPEVLSQYGLSEMVQTAIDSNQHLDGQMIGNIARRNGFEMILAPSHKGMANNLIILK